MANGLRWLVMGRASLRLRGLRCEARVDMATAQDQRKTAEEVVVEASAWLAAVVENSNDAILSKTLDGIITSWNSGAERLFGYSRDNAIGQPITLIIPDDRLHEEADIIARLRRGERVERFETVRRNRDGNPVHIEVTISPVRNADGEIVGASKIARDIGERLRHAEEQTLLVREMQHRIKNLLSIVQGLVSIGARRARDVDSFAEDLTGRIGSLAAAQRLILPGMEGIENRVSASIGTVLKAVLAPYLDDRRIRIDVPFIPAGHRAVTSLALLFHELATNALKYGGLSNPTGSVSIHGHLADGAVILCWKEMGGNPPDDDFAGFGTDLLRAALRGLDGSIEREWDAGSLALKISLSSAKLAL